MDVRLVMFKNGKLREFPLKNGKLSIGRAPDSDLQIPTKDVSRQHCEVLIDAGDLIVHDTGSTNGTFVNGKPIDETELGAGDRLSVGPITFVIRIDGEPTEITAKDVRDPRPAAGKPKTEKPRIKTEKPKPTPAADDDDELPAGLLDVLEDDGKDDDDKDVLPAGLMEDDDEDEDTGELLDLDDLELDIDLGDDDDKKK